jgi:hypothetical protein
MGTEVRYYTLLPSSISNLDSLKLGAGRETRYDEGSVSNMLLSINHYK